MSPLRSDGVAADASASADAPGELVAAQLPVIDVNTGMGAWQTVDRPSARANDAPLTDDGDSAGVSRSRKRARADDSDDERNAAIAHAPDVGVEDTYSMHNPYGGKYRGVAVNFNEEDEVAPQIAARLAAVASKSVPGPAPAFTSGASEPGGASKPGGAAAAPASASAADAGAGRVQIEFKKRALASNVRIRRKGGDDDDE